MNPPDTAPTPGHAPLPWHYQEESDAYTHIIRGPNNEYVCGFSQHANGRAEADARLVVEAVNSLAAHGARVTAEDVNEAFKDIQTQFQFRHKSAEKIAKRLTEILTSRHSTHPTTPPIRAGDGDWDVFEAGTTTYQVGDYYEQNIKPHLFVLMPVNSPNLGGKTFQRVRRKRPSTQPGNDAGVEWEEFEEYKTTLQAGDILVYPNGHEAKAEPQWLGAKNQWKVRRPKPSSASPQGQTFEEYQAATRGDSKAENLQDELESVAGEEGKEVEKHKEDLVEAWLERDDAKKRLAQLRSRTGLLTAEQVQQAVFAFYEKPDLEDCAKIAEMLNAHLAPSWTPITNDPESRPKERDADRNGNVLWLDNGCMVLRCYDWLNPPLHLLWRSANLRFLPPVESRDEDAFEKAWPLIAEIVNYAPTDGALKKTAKAAWNAALSQKGNKS